MESSCVPQSARANTPNSNTCIAQRRLPSMTARLGRGMVELCLDTANSCQQITRVGVSVSGTPIAPSVRSYALASGKAHAMEKVS